MSTVEETQHHGPDVDRALAILANAMRHVEKTSTKAGAPRRSSSFAAQVADLQQGESCAKVKVINPGLLVGEMGKELPLVRERLRNACAPVIAAAKAASPGKEFSVEVGDLWMPRGNLYVVAVVSRCD